MIFDEKRTIELLEKNSLEKLIEPFGASLARVRASADYEKFTAALDELPGIKARFYDFNARAVKIGLENELEESRRAELERALKKLMPWRKGPFEIFGVFVDSEWRSDMKWARIENEISALEGRSVLDIGCGNGYYLLRMLGAGAGFALGVEPYLLSAAQFAAVKKFLPEINAAILPFGVERLPENLRRFDTVFSMGVFYHRRSPFDHLFKLRELARQGGEIILETLVIEGEKGETLVPENRYAKMRNVWFIPSVPTLESWLKRAKFQNIRLIDVTKTTTDEQRKTAWTEFESLEDFLDGDNPEKTIEGYPAPRRAVFIAEAP